MIIKRTMSRRRRFKANRANGEQSSDMIRRVLKGNDSHDEFEFTTIHQIILGFTIKDLQTVLDVTTDTIEWTDSLGRTALFWAVIRDDPDSVEILLSYNANPNAKDLHGFSPLDFVRGPEVCKLLLAAKARINVNPQNYLHSSLHEHVIENGCPEVITLFTDAGLNIDMKDHDDETPLLNSIYAGNTAVVKRLIELGADVNAANVSSHDSALHFAASFDRPEILKILLERSADHTALDCNGRTVAHCAARSGSTELAKILAEAGPKNLDLSALDFEGKTPSHYMSERVILTDAEVGVHEAWEDLVTSLQAAPPQYTTLDTKEGLNEVDLPWSALNSSELEPIKLPGAFPVETIREIGVFES